MTSKALIVFAVIASLVVFLFFKFPQPNYYDQKINGVWYGISYIEHKDEGEKMGVRFMNANYESGAIRFIVNYPENLYVLDGISEENIIPYGGNVEEEMKMKRELDGTIVEQLYNIAIKKWPDKHLEKVTYEKPFEDTFYAKKYVKNN